MVHRLYHATRFTFCFTDRTLRDQNNRVIGWLRERVDVSDLSEMFFVRYDIIPNPMHPDAAMIERADARAVVLAADASLPE